MPMYAQMRREGMRRLCALFLLLLCTAPGWLAFSSLDSISEASLPACCRTHGKHKCFMRFRTEQGAALKFGAAAISQVSEPCPYNLALTTTVCSNFFFQLTKDISWTGFADSAPVVAVATRLYISLRSGANCKRGPPSPGFSLETTTDRLAAQQRAVHSQETLCFDYDGYSHTLPQRFFRYSFPWRPSPR
jgi:hypothetical protein